MIKSYQLMESKRATFLKTAALLKGASMAAGNEKLGELLDDAADYLEDAANHICAQGYYGCNAGAKCTSDHK